MRIFMPLLLVIIVLLSSYKAKFSSEEKVKWLNFSEMAEKMKSNKKPVIIDLYTDWCHWCKVMDKETYQNTKVATYINEKFYAVSFNAEGKQVVNWRNKAYSYNEQYKINTLSIALTNGQLSFPTTIIIPDDTSAPIAIAGMLKPKELELIIKYFGSGAYIKDSFADFQKKFHATW